jgi:hypothetical protein
MEVTVMAGLFAERYVNIDAGQVNSGFYKYNIYQNTIFDK